MMFKFTNRSKRILAERTIQSLQTYETFENDRGNEKKRSLARVKSVKRWEWMLRWFSIRIFTRLYAPLLRKRMLEGSKLFRHARLS